MGLPDHSDPLVLLANALPWEEIASSLSKFYTLNNGRPALPIRLMAGLLILKQLENLSDENMMLQWKRNPYYQYFCGAKSFQNAVNQESSPLILNADNKSAPGKNQDPYRGCSKFCVS